MVIALSDGRVEFRIHRAAAKRITLVGSFTSWEDGAIAMEPAGDGWWHAEVSLPAGDYEFGYRIDGCQWLPDYAASGLKTTDEGGWVSLLHVPTGRAPVVTRAVRTEREHTTNVA